MNNLISLALVVFAFGCAGSKENTPVGEAPSDLSVRCVNGDCTTKSEAPPPAQEEEEEEEQAPAPAQPPPQEDEEEQAPARTCINGFCFEIPGQSGGGSSLSIRCTNGVCQCAAGPKTGTVCDGATGTASSCDRVCAF